MVNSVTARGGGASANGRNLIGLAQGRRSVFLESSWNARHAISEETPVLSSNVNHKHQEAITNHHYNKTPKLIVPVLFHYSRDCCMLEWGRRGDWLCRFHRAVLADGVRGAKHGGILRKPVLGSQTNWTSQALQCTASCSVLGLELNRNAARFREPCPSDLLA